MIKITKTLEWMRKPVLNIIEKYQIKGLKNIKVYNPCRKKKQRLLGSTTAVDGTFQITIPIYSQPNQDKRRKLRKMSRDELMYNLAHELAHCLEWPHGKKHNVITKRIYKSLAKVYKAESKAP